MAKKIRLDFSKVEERSGWKTSNIPEGLHEMKIELVDETPANDGTDMLTYGLRPTNPKYKTRLFPYYCKQQPNQYFKIRDLFIAAGVLDPKKAKGRAVDLITDAPVGKIVAAEVRDGTGQYSERSEIDGIYDRSIIDDDDLPGEDADYDEEYDEEAEEDEVDDEEYEDDEEDEEGDDERAEELEGLGLPALRKEAKALDIDTTGLKKAELIEAILEAEAEADEDDEDEDDLDDEDLDDEELEDEEFEDDEDEEEEEAPAPKRRAAAKAPARKPAAKAPAKAAAPARRVVKRR